MYNAVFSKVTTGVISAFFISLFFFSSVEGAVALDAKSRECIECHVMTTDPEDSSRLCHTDGCDHPLGLDYVTASTGNPGLAPVSELGPSVKLVGKGGRQIGCTTCHVPYSKANHEELSAKRADGGPDPMLSTSNIGSFLCLECHRK